MFALVVIVQSYEIGTRTKRGHIMATTYRIKYRTIINSEIIDKETTFISSVDNLPDAIERFKIQLPAEQQKTFVLISGRIKHTSGLKFTTSDYDKKFGQPAMRRGPKLPDKWRLVNVPFTAWKQDDSGFACLIRWTETDVVRIDLINELDVDGGVFIVSFQGNADDVRKHTMGWLMKHVPTFDLAHAAYIGAELERADTERIDFVQDGTDIRTCDNCGSTDDVNTYTVDQDRRQITACRKCMDRTIGPITNPSD